MSAGSEETELERECGATIVAIRVMLKWLAVVVAFYVSANMIWDDRAISLVFVSRKCVSYVLCRILKIGRASCRERV